MSFLVKNIDSDATVCLSPSAKKVKSPKVKIKPIDCVDLIDFFNGEFLSSHNTCLLGNGEEPEYRPADDEYPYNRIIFTQDYAASALHEIAHWCVAGVTRRQQVDYGYWYEPDGRSKQQQMLFEQVEVKPQALEWIFSKACGLNFRISVDNINGDIESSQPSLLFKQEIVKQAQEYCRGSLNDRAERWIGLLHQYHNNSSSLNTALYTLAALK